MLATKPVGTIESCDSLFAIWTESGPAVFPGLDLLIETRDAGRLAEHVAEHGDADREYYERQGERWPWREASDRG